MQTFDVFMCCSKKKDSHTCFTTLDFCAWKPGVEHPDESSHPACRGGELFIFCVGKKLFASLDFLYAF